MTEYITQIVIALIGAVPPTLMAAAAWMRAKRLEKPIEQVNNAVNHREGGQKRLVELVDEVAQTMRELSDSVSRVEDDLQNHRAWHQLEDENEFGKDT